MVNGPRPPPLLRIKSEPISLPRDAAEDHSAPPTPVQRALSAVRLRVPTVSFEIVDDSAPDDSAPTSPPTPLKRRLSVVITRRRARTTISVPIPAIPRTLAVGFLLLLLASAANAMVLGGLQAPRPVRTPRVGSPLGWASQGAGGQPAGAMPALAALLDEQGLRSRVGLVRRCFDAEHSLELEGVPARSPPRWVLSRVTEAACALAFPAAFGEVRRWRELTKEAASSALADAASELEAALAAALPRGARFTIDARYKSSASLFEKLFLRGKRRANDALGMRVILDERAAGVPADARLCYDAAAVVGGLWAAAAPPKDYISAPKPNGYRSLHLGVTLRGGSRVEVQLRTRCMHETAERGSAAHGRYKLDAAAAACEREGEAGVVGWSA